MIEEFNGEDKVWASMEATVNLGNYENIKLSIGESFSFDPNKDDPEDVRRKIVNFLEVEIKSFRKNIKKKLRAK